MVKRAGGLRVISLDTNLLCEAKCLTGMSAHKLVGYRPNYFNYINSSEPDVSVILRFLTDELLDAEDAGDRVWIIGHVVSSWDGSNPLLNPANLSSALVYQIWKSYVDDYPALCSQTQFGPTFEFEYSTREAYGGNITWGAADPLNVAWWHLVTERIEVDPTLMEAFNSYQGKGSILTPPCTGECILMPEISWRKQVKVVLMILVVLAWVTIFANSTHKYVVLEGPPPHQQYPRSDREVDAYWMSGTILFFPYQHPSERVVHGMMVADFPRLEDLCDSERYVLDHTISTNVD
ncbi:uncharacterized protein F5891DRAFT_976640 [Suillus fuscotomentosus]|uniref:Uncharacterized protein n=1 Tax=Suillus fuscotomentosus TaxID=1912939 RepID=A0AAD4EF41_9AGAM|nr:uncharacterized protein F5891DRAFT_976640 [Suillus fuscotomentosus]KAG1905080.1 hypothetical protein F5891DRAFT_976640 [Suillus fuscotomentosus]